MPYTKTQYTDGSGEPISATNLNKSEDALKLAFDHIELQALELDKKQNILVSGTNIKTVGGVNILGSGDIPLGSSSSATQLSILPSEYINGNYHYPFGSAKINKSIFTGLVASIITITKDITIDAFVTEISGVGSGSGLGVAFLATVDQLTRMPASLVVQSVEFNTNTAGVIEAACNPTLVPAGDYYIVFGINESAGSFGISIGSLPESTPALKLGVSANIPLNTDAIVATWTYTSVIPNDVSLYGWAPRTSGYIGTFGIKVG